MKYLGAAFRKADLQVHSPRDRAWDGEHPEASLDGSASVDDRDSARDQWAAAFVSACLDCGLEAVAITDHHEGLYVWHALEAAKDTPLWVFPGLEVTAKDSAQALVIFDTDLPPALFERARTHLGLPADVNVESPEGIEVELLDHNVDELQICLQSDEELVDRFIILPNVTPGGHRTVLRKGFHKRFRELPYVGGYLDRVTPQDLDDGDRAILEGQIPAWTSQRRGVVTTSDCRNAEFDGLGESCTWVKLASPTAESLRQAMLAADSRLRYQRPGEPSVVVRSLRVENSPLLRIDTVALSSQLNAVIGGRGAGKSTMLELLRFGLGRSALDEPDPTWDPTHHRRKELLAAAFDEGGLVELEIEVDGAAMTVLRTSANRDQIVLEVDDRRQTVTPKDVRKLVPAQVFSQGALSHLAREEAESRLRDVITEPRHDELQETERTIEEQSTEIGRQLVRLSDLWSTEDSLRTAQAEYDTTAARAEALRAAISDDDGATREVIDAHPRMARIERALLEGDELGGRLPAILTRAVEEAQGEIDDLIEKWKALDAVGSTPITSALAELRILMEERMNALLQAVRDQWESVEAATPPLRDQLAEHDEKYRTALARIEGQEEKVAQLRELESALGNLEEQRERLASQAESLADSSDLLSSAWETRTDAEFRKQDLLAEAANEVRDRTNGLARAALRRHGDVSELSDALGRLFEGTYVRENRMDDLLDHIRLSDSPRAKWRALFDESIDLLKWKILGGAEDAQPELEMFQQHIDAGGMERLEERLDIERIATVAKALFEPRLQVFQQREGGEYEFHQASQGERATTLLTLLMSQHSGPLLIDQPEEDLDNRIIGEIVIATRLAKDKRQLIYATHNANIVVNGDAELVVELHDGSAANVGAIDHAEVRDGITETMEGGKEAFELRRKKYNF